MIASISSTRSDGHTSFHKLGKYLTVERDTASSKEVARGEVVLSGNIYDPESVADEMRTVARQNKLVGDPIMHFQIAWKPGEHPQRREWEDAAKKAIAALGFDEHQYMMAAHDDKAHFHVHVMLNRVHPETLAAHNPRLTMLTLDRTMRELEHEYGRAETPGPYRWDRATNKPIRNTREEIARRRQEYAEGKEVAPQREKMDHYADTESVKAFAAKEPARALKQLLSKDASWQQVHVLLSHHGLEIHKAEKGGYSVSVEGSSIRVKASDVFRFAFSGKENRDRTEHRLGAYQPANLGSTFEPVTVDYSQASPDQKKGNYAKYLSQPNPTEDRRIASAKTIDHLRSVSRINVVRWSEADKMLLHSDAQHQLRQPGAKEHFSVRRGGNSEHQAIGGGGDRRSIESTKGDKPSRPQVVKDAPIDRQVPWKQQQIESLKVERQKAQRDTAKNRRAERVAERRKESDELKKDFGVVRSANKAALHEHTERAKKSRGELNAGLKRDKLTIRSLDIPWKAKQAMLSQRVMEHVIAKQRLNLQITGERAAVPQTTFQQWVEVQAERGDKRAAAQMRGWRYQDQRNVRKTDREIEQDVTKRAGQLSGDALAEEEGRNRRESDWQELANERIRQLKEQEAQLAGLNTIKWKADSRSGDVTYSIAGVASLVDKGKTITVLHHDLEATKIALQMAVHKYGNVIEAKGSDVWERQLVRAAVEQNLNVSFTDERLQRALAKARQDKELSKAPRRQVQRSNDLER